MKKTTLGKLKVLGNFINVIESRDLHNMLVNVGSTASTSSSLPEAISQGQVSAWQNHHIEPVVKEALFAPMNSQNRMPSKKRSSRKEWSTFRIYGL